MSFLNSPLGLWLLSTLFISVGSWTYTKWAEDREAYKQKSERIQNLDLEIGNRFDQGDSMMNYARDPETRRIDATTLAAVPGTIFLPPGQEAQLFPQYSTRSLRSLLLELSALLEGAEAICVDHAINDARFAQLKWMRRPPRPSDIRQFQSEIESLANQRWSHSARSARLEAGPDGLIGNAAEEAEPYCNVR